MLQLSERKNRRALANSGLSKVRHTNRLLPAKLVNGNRYLCWNIKRAVIRATARFAGDRRLSHRSKLRLPHLAREEKLDLPRLRKHRWSKHHTEVWEFPLATG